MTENIVVVIMLTVIFIGALFGHLWSKQDVADILEEKYD